MRLPWCWRAAICWGFDQRIITCDEHISGVAIDATVLVLFIIIIITLIQSDAIAGFVFVIRTIITLTSAFVIISFIVRAGLIIITFS